MFDPAVRTYLQLLPRDDAIRHRHEHSLHDTSASRPEGIKEGRAEHCPHGEM